MSRHNGVLSLVALGVEDYFLDSEFPEELPHNSVFTMIGEYKDGMRDGEWRKCHEGEIIARTWFTKGVNTVKYVYTPASSPVGKRMQIWILCDDGYFRKASRKWYLNKPSQPRNYGDSSNDL